MTIIKNHRAAFAVLGCLWAAAAPAPGSAAEPPRRPELAACSQPGLPPDALCGTYEVFENRAARSGRKIPLKVVVIPAKGAARERLSDPLVYFAGGPGDASIPGGGFLAQELASLHQRRDVLLVDFRGTGESGGLFCHELQGEQGVQAFLDDFLPTPQVRACRDRLKKVADLSWYTSDAAIDDIEEVRAALGYSQLNLIGGSYGTRAVLTYMRRHPQSVRTATLFGVVAPDEHYPLGLARGTQEALDGLIAECEGDAACRGAFPKLRQEVDAVMRRVAAEPVRVGLIDPKAGRPFELRLGQQAVVQTLRYMLYSPSEAALLPLVVHHAAQGDFKPLAQLARLFASVMTATSDPFYLSVTCAEDLAFIREKDIAPAVAGTVLGDFRVRQQLAACEGWPTRDLGQDVQAPIVSDIPTLLVSGERDPATPASSGHRVARTLKRGLHLVIADAGHSTSGMKGTDCFFGMVGAFIESGRTEGLDTSCAAGMKRPDFVLSLGDPEVTVSRADLDRLVGSYADEKTGMLAQVDVVEGRLRLQLVNGPAMMLISTSPTRFRLEGLAPSNTMIFQLSGGRATEAVLSLPGEDAKVLKRRE